MDNGITTVTVFRSFNAQYNDWRGNLVIMINRPMYSNPCSAYDSFNKITTIGYEVKEPVHTTTEVFNIKGQKVIILTSGLARAGKYSTTLGGSDNQGRQVTSGIYYHKMMSNKYTSSRKVVLAK